MRNNNQVEIEMNEERIREIVREELQRIKKEAATDTAARFLNHGDSEGGIIQYASLSNPKLSL